MGKRKALKNQGSEFRKVISGGEFTKSLISENENNFYVSLDSVIYIYGCGIVGQKMDEKLTADGFRVKGYIDRKAEDIKEIRNKRVLKPEWITSDYRNDVFIITFQNILEQERVAADLYKKGIDNIVFLNRNAQVYEECFEKYNHLMLDRTVAAFSFPKYKINVEECRMLETWSEDYCIAEVPVPLIYCSNTVIQSSGNAEFGNKCFTENNISVWREYHALFKALLGESYSRLDLQHLLEINCGRNRNVNSYLNDRLELLRFFEKEFRQKGIAFFRKCPPFAVWNNGGYFNLKDGHHRAAFLYNYHQKSIPLRMRTEDFEKWENKQKAEAVLGYINKEKIELKETILNPLFLNNQDAFDAEYHIYNGCYIFFYNENGGRKYRVLDMSFQGAYFAQLFARMGMQRIDMVVESPEQKKLYQMILELYGYNSIHMLYGLESSADTNYDIVIFREDFLRDKTAFITKFIQKCRSRYIIVISDGEEWNVECMDHNFEKTAVKVITGKEARLSIYAEY